MYYLYGNDFRAWAFVCSCNEHRHLLLRAWINQSSTSIFPSKVLVGWNIIFFNFINLRCMLIVRVQTDLDSNGYRYNCFNIEFILFEACRGINKRLTDGLAWLFVLYFLLRRTLCWTVHLCHFSFRFAITIRHFICDSKNWLRTLIKLSGCIKNCLQRRTQLNLLFMNWFIFICWSRSEYTLMKM